MSDDNVHRLARRPGRNPLGKLDAEISKIRVPALTKAILAEGANEAGMDLTEYGRWVLMIHAHGLETVQRIRAEQIDAIAGNGSETGERGA